ncbi:hypothetical protein ACFVHS_29805 [Streptomyces sp. NPDC057746]|uniref:hypothetical protein n=1 Tax=Streptomyces sp. NPDC057746 TaxID=3346237 RepID=UPI00369A51C6
MGERLSGDGVPGRAGVHPDDSALETALAVALRGALDPAAEQHAVAAFRTAYDADAQRARTRRRYDGRPPAARHTRRPVKTALGVVFASIALGGVAVAAIGSVGPSKDGDSTMTAGPSPVAPDRPAGGTASASAHSRGPTKQPITAKDTAAHCRAYEQFHNRGKALEATAWQRLVAAAGGNDKVASYCSERLARATAEPGKRGGQGAADSGRGNKGAGTGASANHPGRTGSASENARAGEGKAGEKDK